MLFVSFNRNPAHYVKDGQARSAARLVHRSEVPAGDRAQRRHEEHDPEHLLRVRRAGGVVDLAGEHASSTIPNLKPYEYDLERGARGCSTKAATAIATATASARTPRANALEFELSTNAGNQVRERLCSILKEDWTKLGIKVNYRPLDFATLVEKLSVNFDWDAMVMGFTGGVEPHNGANLLRSSGNLHLWHPNQEKPATAWEAEIDRELDAARASSTSRSAAAHYWRIQEILHASCR